MKLDFQLKLEQTQKLIITPELKLAITLLQYSALELVDYVQEELLNNPVLEIQETESEDKEAGAESFDAPADKPADEGFSWEEYFRDVDWSSREASAPQPWEGQPSVENYAGEAGTMMEDLLGQLRLMRLPPRKFSMASFLVGNLDQNGYLRADLDELAQALGATAEELEAVLETVQLLEPTGIASRSLQECLLIQLKRLESPPGGLAMEIVKNYLPAAADGRFRHIAARLNCDLKAVQEAVDFIRTLNPKPGSIYGEGDDTRYIIPDIIVEKVEQDYVIIVNDSATPQLSISPFYQKLLQGGGDESLSSYVRGLDHRGHGRRR